MVLTRLEKEPQPPISFKEVLLQCAFSQGRVLPDSVHEIDLGIFGQEARLLYSKTLSDSLHREFGKNVFITRDKKVLLQNKPIEGDEKSVFDNITITMSIDDVRLPWFLRQDKICAGCIHSHPVEKEIF